MSNPWLKKNPFMSMWLSSANAVVGSARGKVVAEARRQSKAAASKVTTDIFNMWAPPVAVVPKKRKAKR